MFEQDKSHTPHPHHGQHAHPLKLAVMIGALGVVFGDIGTSPLYALKTGIIAIEENGVFDPTHVYGMLSLIFWMVTLVITVKYIIFVLRADNDGEGGILALMTLMRLQRNATGLRVLLLLAALAGAACLLADGVITPAISVLSAIEGISVIAPSLEHWIVPITMAIIIAVFMSQRYGTEKISKFYGPITLVWFITLGILGLLQIIPNPQILKALNPYYAVTLLQHYPGLSAIIIGAAFLAITGGEALYADMGHFGRRNIQYAWLFIVMPCLLLNYFGQGALVIADNTALENPFYMLAPSWFKIPLLILATAATVIASQAMITGAFALTKQAIEIGYFPPMRMTNTSEYNQQHIYINRLNNIMMFLSLFLIMGFRTSENLAHAYGVAVATTMLGTCILYFTYVWGTWRVPKIFILMTGALFIGIDVILVSANLSKIADGGWFTLLMAGITLVVMIAWHKGVEHVIAEHMKATEPMEEFAARTLGAPLCPINRAAVFFSRSGVMAPVPLERMTDMLRVKFSHVVIVSIRISSHPRIAHPECVRVTIINEHFMKLDIRVGYLQSLNIPALIGPSLRAHNIEPEDIIYCIGHDRIIGPQKIRSPRDLVNVLFTFLAATAERAVDRFGLPRKRTLEIGYAVRLDH